MTVASVAVADPVCRGVWSTVDDFVLPGTTGASASAILVDDANTWVAGMSSDALSGHWVVRKRTGNNPFTTVDDFIYTIGVRNNPTTILASGSTVLVAGGANNASEYGPWLVRRSTNSGGSWTIADEFGAAPVASRAYGSTIDSTGAVFVSGFGVAADGYHWYTRRSPNFGATWATVADFAPLVYSTGARAMTTEKGGAVFATGYNFNGHQYHWQTRKLSGGAWVLVDDWAPLPDSTGQTYGAQPQGAAAGKTPGVVMIVGSAVMGDLRGHWIVRRTLDGGATWTIVDDLPDCGARSLAFDKKDEKGFYVSGRCYLNGGYHWVTRRSDETGLNWVTEDDYAMSSPSPSYPNAIDFGKNGDVYAVGVANDGTGNHWLVRKRSCQGNANAPTTALRAR